MSLYLHQLILLLVQMLLWRIIRVWSIVSFTIFFASLRLINGVERGLLSIRVEHLQTTGVFPLHSSDVSLLMLVLLQDVRAWTHLTDISWHLNRHWPLDNTLSASELACFIQSLSWVFKWGLFQQGRSRGTFLIVWFFSLDPVVVLATLTTVINVDANWAVRRRQVILLTKQSV